MKKVFAFCLSFFCASCFLFAAGFSAQVVSFSGKAEVLSDGNWKPLSVGYNLASGDVVQTGFKSSLTLKIKDSTVTVEPLTRMTVEKLSENSEKDNVRLFVDAGGVSSSVKKSGNKKVGFTVRTPVATASVRGTEFSVQNNFDSAKVETKSGSVAVWKGKNSVSVDDDETSGGDSESDYSFENTPHGAIFVKKGQETSVARQGAISFKDEIASAVYSMPTVPNSPVEASSLVVNGSLPDSASLTVATGTVTEDSSLTITVKTK